MQKHSFPFFNSFFHEPHAESKKHQEFLCNENWNDCCITNVKTKSVLRNSIQILNFLSSERMLALRSIIAAMLKHCNLTTNSNQSSQKPPKGPSASSSSSSSKHLPNQSRLNLKIDLVKLSHL